MIPPVCENRDRFQCYCHQSTYNILGEKLQLGPAARGMDRFPVRIDDGVVDHRHPRDHQGPAEGHGHVRRPAPTGRRLPLSDALR